LLAGGVAAGVPAGFAGVAAPLPVPLVVPVEVPVVPVVDAGVGGNETNGVGSGGSGLDRMPATIASTAVSGSFGLRNLYQVFRLSLHAAF
jgi:hypothetical protein